MAPKAGGASTGTNEYDPEIKDIAEYIHNYKIDSDLAVRGPQATSRFAAAH